jgi:hypothetical protein
MKLVISNFGVFLGRKGERFVVKDMSGGKDEFNACAAECWWSMAAATDGQLGSLCQPC